MSRRRFFVEGIHAGTAELTGEDAHHLARVLRAAPGQQYEVCDGAAAWLADVTDVRKDRVAFRLIEPVPSAVANVRITVCAALVKFDRFEWMVEKATELGVERIVAFQAARSDKGLLEAAGKRVERWRKIARESSQQSRRLAPPGIDVLPAREHAAEAVKEGYRYFLDEEPGAPGILDALPATRREGDAVAAMVGPEGGWTPAEREETLARGWSPVSVGPHVLRAETATVAAAAVLTAAWLGAPLE